jgi:hypothetical protein
MQTQRLVPCDWDSIAKQLNAPTDVKNRILKTKIHRKIFLINLWWIIQGMYQMVVFSWTSSQRDSYWRQSVLHFKNEIYSFRKEKKTKKSCWYSKNISMSGYSAMFPDENNKYEIDWLWICVVISIQIVPKLMGVKEPSNIICLKRYNLNHSQTMKRLPKQ